MDVTVEEARNLVADQALWPRVRDFLWDFAPQVHPSWLEDLFSSDSPLLGHPLCGQPSAGGYASLRLCASALKILQFLGQINNAKSQI